MFNFYKKKFGQTTFLLLLKINNSWIGNNTILFYFSHLIQIVLFKLNNATQDTTWILAIIVFKPNSVADPVQDPGSGF